MKLILLALVILALGTSVWAHEGHNKTPGALVSPHGGQIKGTSQLYLELVTDSQGLKLYTLDHDLKSLPANEVKIEGSLKWPRQKKSEKLNLAVQSSFFESKVDAKGSHRYTVDLKVTFKNKIESVSFTVEPQE